MSISARFETSHRFSFEGHLKLVFKITVVPEKRVTAAGLHYQVLLDTSDSMKGEKLESTRKVAFSMLQSIPPGNVASLVAFDSLVYNFKELADPKSAAEALRTVREGGGTAMYSALRYAGILATKSQLPGYIIMLTDGFPTDLSTPEAYAQLPIPSGYRIVVIGVGNDYNETLLKSVADRAGGLFHHLTNTSELSKFFQVPSSIGAKNVRVNVDSPSEIKFLNYPNPPLRLGVLEGSTKIYGETTLPPSFKGDIALRV
jgi:Ca-activated chloride channel family protein